MTQAVQVNIRHVQGDVYILFAFPELFTVSEAGESEASVDLDAGFSHIHLAGHGSVGLEEGIIGPSFRTNAFGFHDQRGASGVLVEEAAEEGEANALSVGALQAFSDLRVGLAGGNAFEDTGPAALVSDLLLDEAFNRFGGQGNPFGETPLGYVGRAISARISPLEWAVLTALAETPEAPSARPQLASRHESSCWR